MEENFELEGYKKYKAFKLKMLEKLPLCDFDIDDIIDMTFFSFCEKLKKLNFYQLDKLYEKVYNSERFKTLRKSKKGLYNMYFLVNINNKFNALSEMISLTFVEGDKPQKDVWPVHNIKIVDDFFK
ncbi:hypothetical protein ['Cynodon dactylon' phytoplasma]|uniref:hypothetical protein n=1 Tax='Cynodon dactylon' phytoplasma TaxID=295320 RepID=UPI001265D08E|nr:hypothetical protein ['Cynodon dactylon' phytoplasma]KAB8121683.1 hypothetical protein F1741_02175 ['Cynodon dactylon' phytoplasma]